MPLFLQLIPCLLFITFLTHQATLIMAAEDDLNGLDLPEFGFLPFDLYVMVGL